MIHLIKLAVGIRDVAHLETVQRERAAARGDLSVRHAYTRNKPVRPEVEDGSLYWIVKGVIRCRQRILGFDTQLDENGKRYCLIVLDPTIVTVMPAARAAFQGWRYLEPAKAPPDLAVGAGGELPPDAMLKELRSLGLI